MIQENTVSLSLRIDKINMYKTTNFNDCRIDSNQMAEFFILPTYSYFGDYNMLMNLRSQIQYKAA
jgi:hypothetical protein